jgi:hypothetical protein
MFEVLYILRPRPVGGIHISKIRHDETRLFGYQEDISDEAMRAHAKIKADELVKAYNLQECEVFRITQINRRDVPLK